MSFYLGPYAIVNPFEEISGGNNKYCSKDKSHFINHQHLKTKDIHYCSICGEKLTVNNIENKKLKESNIFNLRYYKNLKVNSDDFDFLELNNQKTIWKIKSYQFSLNIDDSNNGSQEITKEFREKSIIYFNQLFHDYEDFFEKNDILYIVDFGFISEI